MDALSAMMMLDNGMSAMLYNMAPHRNLLNPNEPRQISNNIAMPATVISLANNWLRDKEESEPTDKMAEFAV